MGSRLCARREERKRRASVRRGEGKKKAHARRVGRRCRFFRTKKKRDRKAIGKWNTQKVGRKKKKAQVSTWMGKKGDP